MLPTRQLLAALWSLTREGLAPLGLREQPLPPELAAADSGQRTHLSAACWQLGPTEAPVAECRIVRIVGAASEIVNVLVFPRRPDLLPTFVAELLVFGGCPRLAFVDLQVPGLPAEQVAEVAERTRQLAGRYACLPPAGSVPDWASVHSAGHWVFTRPSDPAYVPDLVALFEDYLQLWVQFAQEADAMVPAVAGAASALSQFKAHHLEKAPVRDFLVKVFGAAWAERFLTEFLYR